MRYFNIAFEEVKLELYASESSAAIHQYSPSSKVPALLDNEMLVWDSLAIFEYLNEKYPEKKMWPFTKEQRAHARSVCCEMHSGFHVMRELMTHNVKVYHPNFDYSPALKDVQRIIEIWHDCFERSGGPFLFGSQFTIADAMFAPVVNRFVSYDVKCNSVTLDYIKLIRSLPAHQEWIAAGIKEV